MSSLKVSVAAEFFDDDCFSNLIIELKGKSIKVNTVILCNNGLFHELCKPDRGLKKEKYGREVLELKNDDDDPHALEILIRHLYSIPTTSDTGSWESWLSVYQTANKFHEYDLSNEALDNLVKHALAKKDMSELAAIVKGVKTEAEECDNSLLAEYVARLIKPNVRERFKVHGFRRWLGGEKELMLAVIEELISD